MMLTIHFLSLPFNLKNYAFYIASLIPNSRLVATLFDVLHIRKKEKETINTEKEERIVYKNNWTKRKTNQYNTEDKSFIDLPKYFSLKFFLAMK